MFCTTGLVSWKYVAQMYEEEIHFGNCYFNGFGRFDPSDLDHWPSDPNVIRTKCGLSLRRVGQSVLELLIGKGFDTFDPGDLYLWPSTRNINRVPLLPQPEVWTKFEKGWSRHSRVIDWKRKDFRRTGIQTDRDRPTDMCKAICPLFFEGGMKRSESLV